MESRKGILYIIKTAARFVKQGGENNGKKNTKQAKKRGVFLEEIF